MMRNPLWVALVCLACAGCSGSKAAGPPPTDATTPTVDVTLTDAGCNPTSFTLGAGPVIFHVTNPTAAPAKVTEMEIQHADGHVLNDVEGVQPGHTRSFVVNLVSGMTYRVRCPQDAKSGGDITVK